MLWIDWQQRSLSTSLSRLRGVRPERDSSLPSRVRPRQTLTVGDLAPLRPGASKALRKKGTGVSGPSSRKQDGGQAMVELEKKDELINDLEDTIEILQLKVNKLEQLVSLKE